MNDDKSPLEKYGRHESECSIMWLDDSFDAICTCGLADAIQAEERRTDEPEKDRLKAIVDILMDDYDLGEENNGDYEKIATYMAHLIIAKVIAWRPLPPAYVPEEGK